MKNRINCYIRVTDPDKRKGIAEWAKKNHFGKVFIDDAGEDYIVHYNGVITNAKSLRLLIEEECYEFVDCDENIQLFYALTAYDKYVFNFQYFVDVYGNWAQGVIMRDARGQKCYCIDALDDDFEMKYFRRATKEELIKKAKSWTCTTK